MTYVLKHSISNRIYFVAACLFASALSSFGQSMPNFHFRKYQVDDGLSENAVYCILQDTRGFMWFGTKDGLNKFDGTEFGIFQHDANKPESLGNNFIRCIVEISPDTMCIGTDAGLYLMNKKSESFEKLKHTDNLGNSITSAVNNLHIDRNGTLWIATMFQGVFTYDLKSTALEHVEVKGHELGKNAVWFIHEDRSGIVWAGTRVGLLRYNADNNYLEPVNGLFKMQDNSENEILTIAEDKKGNLWLGTWESGMRFYNKQSESFASYFNSKDKSEYITHIRTIFQYSPDCLMIGSDDGLYLFYTDTEKYARIDVPQSKYSLSDQNVYSVLRDKEGGIWIGTYFGGVNYSGSAQSVVETYYSETTPESLSGKAVSQFCEDKRNNIWIATEDGGVNYFNTKTKQFSQPISTSYHNTHALLLDGNDLWIGTFSRGIDVYDTNTGKLRNYRNGNDDPKTLNDNCIFSLYKTKNGDIYAGTPVGLNKYVESEDKFIRLNDFTAFVYDMREDEHGNLWVATYGDGVVKLDAVSGEWTLYDKILEKDDPAVNSKLTSIYIDCKKRIWFSSEGRGIFVYDPSNDRFKNISKADGLPNNVIYGILDDPSGNIWLSCNKGLVCFDPAKPDDSKLYNKQDGLQSTQFNYKSSFKSNDGKFYFGGINGFNCFYPQDLRANVNEVIPGVEITEIQVLSDADKKPEQKIRPASIDYSIKLPYDRSSITISYRSLSFVSQMKNRYTYKLEGIDKEWNHAGNNQKVTYVNLAPGSYVFKVKGSNNDGLWNEKCAGIEVEILPPFWLTTTAKFVYILLCLSLTCFLTIFFFRKHSIRQKRQLEAYKNEQNTLAFKSKIDFFTTIAHEIRTPLSLIKAPLEDIVQSDDGNEATKQNLSVIEKNCDRLTVLINQLLDFRKMDASTCVVDPETMDLRKFVQNLFERFKKTAQSNHINFELQLPENPAVVVSDSDALTKIVANLLSNALKFTKDYILLKLNVNPDETYTISVEDNGIGIPDELKIQIFEPFYQINDNAMSAFMRVSRKTFKNTGVHPGTLPQRTSAVETLPLPASERNPYRSDAGSGIGLSLVKHLVEVLNGGIKVIDNPNGGSVFVFTFGEIKSAVKNEFKETSEEINIRREEINPNRKREILLVEDNDEMVRFIVKSLGSSYSVDYAHDAFKAFDLLETKVYDLIVSDIMMPGIDGISFVKKLKTDTDYSHIPVILLSAKTDTGIKVEGLASGADVFIEKPFSISYLKAQITSLLENRKILLDTFNKSPLAPYSLLAPTKNDEQFLIKLNEEIEKHISDVSFSIESLTDILHVSRSNLQRKLKAVCGVTPGDYLRNYRLKRACLLLLETDMRINEIAYKVGFNSASYFTKVFMKQYGLSPSDYIKRAAEKRI